MSLASPLLALLLTVLSGGVMFAARGLDPLALLYVYFLDPLATLWSLEELAVKAAPLVLIGAGLAVSFRAGVWNIGAEGQLVTGAIVGSAVPVLWHDWQSPWVLPVMLGAAAFGGALYAALPAILKNRAGVNEILTSLMLVYVAQYFLDWLVRGPWRDPQGFNFPRSVTFEGWQRLPVLGDSRLHLGVGLALLAVAAVHVLQRHSLVGFSMRIGGEAPRASVFSGFSRSGTVWLGFMLSGALAGLAGICEVAGPGGHLQPAVSPGYGFTAIIVAFLGRLHAAGVLLAGLLLALTYLGAEAAQMDMGVSVKTSQVFQGMLLFFILACDTAVRHRFRMAIGRSGSKRGQ